MDAQALGRYLRQSREAKELTLEEAEHALRIRRRILESFELGEFSLPDFSPVQIRGFMRNYAHFLGLDEDRVLEYYEAALLEGTRRGRRKKKNKRAEQPAAVSAGRATQSGIPVAPRSITDTNPSLPVVPASMLVGRQRSGGMLNRLIAILVGLAALAVIGLVVLQVLQQQSNQQPGPAPQSDIFNQLPASPTVINVATITPAPSPTPLPGLQQSYSGQGVAVTIETTQRTWISLSTDDTQQYIGIARPGTLLDYRARNTITVSASNAEALSIIYNGQPQQLLGGRGQKVDITFTTTAMQVSTGPLFAPTSAFSPTPIPTSATEVGTLIAQLTPSNTPGPSPTPTLTPTITPTPSETPIPSDTPTMTLTPSDTPPPTLTPTITLTSTITLTPSPTAILPPREPAETATPTKAS